MASPEAVFWFDGWRPLGRIVLVGAAAYFFLLAIVRASGKRTLSGMTTFDLIISVAVGSAFGRMLTAEDVALAEAATAFVLLVGLEYLLSLLATASPRADRLLSPEPRLLFFQGRLLHRAMRRERLREGDLLAAARSHGYGSLDDVEAIVLEKTGAVSVISRQKKGDGSALPGGLRER